MENGIHMAQEEEEGLFLLCQPLKFGNGYLVQVFGFGASSLIGTPAGVVDVLIEAPGGGITCKADAGCIVTIGLQYLCKGGKISSSFHPHDAGPPHQYRRSIPVSMDA